MTAEDITCITHVFNVMAETSINLFAGEQQSSIIMNKSHIAMTSKMIEENCNDSGLGGIGGGLVGGLVSSVASIGASVVQGAVANMGIANGALGGMLGGLGQQLTGMATNMITGLGNQLVGGLMNKVYGAVGGIMNKIAGPLNKLGGFANKLTGFTGKLGNLGGLSSLPGMAAGATQLLAQAGASLPVINAAVGVTQTLTNGMNAINNVTNTITGTINNGIKTVTGTITKGTEAITKGAQATLNKGMETVTGAVNNTLKKAGDSVGNFVGKATDTAKGIMKPVTDTFQKGKDAVTKVADNTVKAVTNAPIVQNATKAVQGTIDNITGKKSQETTTSTDTYRTVTPEENKIITDFTRDVRNRSLKDRLKASEVDTDDENYQIIYIVIYSIDEFDENTKQELYNYYTGLYDFGVTIEELCNFIVYDFPVCFTYLNLCYIFINDVQKYINDVGQIFNDFVNEEQNITIQQIIHDQEDIKIQCLQLQEYIKTVIENENVRNNIIDIIDYYAINYIELTNNLITLIKTLNGIKIDLNEPVTITEDNELYELLKNEDLS